MKKPFFKWMSEIDCIFGKKYGMSLLNSHDHPWRQMFEDDLTSEQAIQSYMSYDEKYEKQKIEIDLVMEA